MYFFATVSGLMKNMIKVSFSFFKERNVEKYNVDTQLKCFLHELEYKVQKLQILCEITTNERLNAYRYEHFHSAGDRLTIKSPFS